MTNKPRRQKKADRILHNDAQASEIRCDYAIAPLDRLARTMDLFYLQAVGGLIDIKGGR